jgi:hypothetical protein
MWTAADPLGVAEPGKTDLNLYAYVRGRTLRSTDPSGCAERDEQGQFQENRNVTVGQEGQPGQWGLSTDDLDKEKKDLQEANTFARLSEDAYNDKSKGLPSGWERVSDAELLRQGFDATLLRDTTSGFQANVYFNKEKNAFAVAFRGTELNSGEAEKSKDVKADLAQGAGLVGDQYRSAVLVGDQLADLGKRSGASVITTGHSLGGGLAAAAALTAGSRAITFNAAGLHENTVSYASGLNQGREGASVVNYHIKAEVLSSAQEIANPLLPVAYGSDKPLPSRIASPVKLHEIKEVQGAITGRIRDIDAAKALRAVGVQWRF